MYCGDLNKRENASEIASRDTLTALAYGEDIKSMVPFLEKNVFEVFSRGKGVAMAWSKMLKAAQTIRELSPLPQIALSINDIKESVPWRKQA
jgi:hypothetical protein